MSHDLLNKSEIEQKHFYEERFKTHAECWYSSVSGVTVGVCKCGEYFFVHMDPAFSAERQLKTQWRAHAKGRKQ